MPRVCRVGDAGSHGGTITTGSDNVFVNSKKVARVNDTYACALHGAQPLVTGSPTLYVNSRKVVRVGDTAACGAVMIEGSPTHTADGVA